MNKVEQQSWNGYINLYKPAGITSFMAVKMIKRLQKGLKIGHLGTLDPMAEGVLPVALGNATRLISYIKDRSKKYYAQAILGAISDTQDIWGEVKYQELPLINKKMIEDILPEYRGLIKQLPPMYSAVHHKGKRLYELARQGIEVERNIRETFIYDLKLVAFEAGESGSLPRIHLDVHCSEGTYIRTLCHDIGQRLACGAVMCGLKRSAWGQFDMDSSIELERIVNGEVSVEDVILPLDEPLQEMISINISDPDIRCRLNNGNRIEYSGPLQDGILRLIDSSSSELLALARCGSNDEGQYLQPVLVLKR